MAAVLADGGLKHLRRPAWRHPEWWCMGLSAGAWLILLYRSAGDAATPVRWHGAGHADALHAGPAGLSHWLLMVVAMMLPLVRGPIRATATRTLWNRRDRAIGGFLAGYVAVWMAAGALGALGLGVLGAHLRVEPLAAAAGAFTVAALWQQTPARRRAVMACHRTVPLAPRGWRADRDCLRYGWMVGTRCLISCWAVMAACVALEHSVAVMAFVGGLGAVERYTARPDQRLLCAALAAAALTCAFLAVR
jgi:predicted metal-binding membrane protein